MALPAINRAESLYFAQPYNLNTTGFYFAHHEEYTEKSARLLDDFGNRVEEFELQFIDGDDLEGALFKAIGVNQANLKAYLTYIEDATEAEMVQLIIADDAGYSIDLDDLDFDIDVYPDMQIRDLVELFLDEGFFGDVPDNLRFYLDTKLIGRDLSYDYTEITIAGVDYVYRMS